MCTCNRVIVDAVYNRQQLQHGQESIDNMNTNISEYVVLDKQLQSSLYIHITRAYRYRVKQHLDLNLTVYSPGIQLTAPSEEPQQVPVVQPMQIHPDLQKQLKLHQEEQLLCGQEKNEEEEQSEVKEEEEEEEVQGEQEEDNQACDEVSYVKVDNFFYPDPC